LVDSHWSLAGPPLRALIEIATGLGAGVLFILLLVFFYGPTTALMDFVAKLWQTWKGKRRSTND